VKIGKISKKIFSGKILAHLMESYQMNQTQKNFSLKNIFNFQKLLSFKVKKNSISKSSELNKIIIV
jgi:hypothetical protein